jgi:GxxExxY protein
MIDLERESTKNTKNTNKKRIREEKEMELIFKDEVYAIMGAAMEVHKELGSGFLEAVYQEALEIEFSNRKIPFESQRNLRINYKDRVLEKVYIADFICFEQILVELKAQGYLTGKEEAQVLNYLKATGLKLGVVINFGSSPKLEWKRLVR